MRPLTIPPRLKPGLVLLGRGFDWWLDELESLLPERWRAHLAPAPPRVVVTLEKSGLGVFRIRRGRPVPLTRKKATLALPATVRDWPRAVLRKLKSAGAIGVLLNPDLTLRRTLRLPLSAEDHLGQVLMLQADRHVPLQSDLAYVDSRIIARDKTAGTLEVEMAVARRADVDPVLAMLKGAGFPVALVGVEGAPLGTPGAYNFLREDAKTRGRAARRVTAALVAALVLIALAGQSLIGVKQRAEASYLQARIDALAATVAKAHDLSDDVKARLDEQRLAVSGRKDFDPLALLNDLSSRVPDGTWLTQIEVRRSKGEVRLGGLTSNATALLGILEAAPALAEVRLKGPIMKDPQGRERFDIEARLVNEGQS